MSISYDWLYVNLSLHVTLVKTFKLDTKVHH